MYYWRSECIRTATYGMMNWRKVIRALVRGAQFVSEKKFSSKGGGGGGGENRCKLAAAAHSRTNN